LLWPAFHPGEVCFFTPVWGVRQRNNAKGNLMATLNAFVLDLKQERAVCLPQPRASTVADAG
jgi:hypothetical protein